MMTVTTLQCERPGCTKKVEAENTATALELLKLHDTQAHSSQVQGHATKPEKPKRPQLAMSGDAVEAEDWDEFIFKFETYKERAGVTNNSTSHLLECLSSEVHSVLFSTHGREISKQTEANLLKNIWWSGRETPWPPSWPS